MRNAMLATIMFFAACGTDDGSSDLMLTGSEESYVINAQGQKECLGKKELVCHIPPGNPANAHTICVSKHAVDTHESHHGDAAGACAAEPPGDPGDGTLPPPGGGGECGECGPIL